MESLPKAMFLLVPLLGVLLRKAYEHVMPFYVPHLYFAIHWHSAAFVILGLTALASWLVPPVDPWRWVARATLATYTGVALMRVYGGRSTKTLFQGFTALVLYWLLTGLVMLFVVVVKVVLLAKAWAVW